VTTAPKKEGALGPVGIQGCGNFEGEGEEGGEKKGGET